MDSRRELPLKAHLLLDQRLAELRRRQDEAPLRLPEWLGLASIVALFACLTAFVVVSFATTELFLATAVPAEARIHSLGIAQSWMPHHGYTGLNYPAVVAFALPDGEEVFAAISLDLISGPRYEVGDRISIAYQPSHPRQAMHDQSFVGAHWAEAISLMLVGGCLWLFVAAARAAATHQQFFTMMAAVTLVVFAFVEALINAL